MADIWFANGRRVFNEYAFYKFVEKGNEELVKYNRPIITTSQARALRQKLPRYVMAAMGQYEPETNPHGYKPEMATTGGAMRYATPNQFMKGLYGLIMDNDLQLTYLRTQLASEQFATPILNDIRQSFADMTGVSVNGIKPQVAKSDMELKLPVSPYMPEFSTTKSMLDAGSRLAYVTKPEATILSSLKNVPISGMKLSQLLYADEAMMGEHEAYQSLAGLQCDGQKLGFIGSIEDLSGLSALRGYMSEDEYNDLMSPTYMKNGESVPWVSGYRDENNNPVYMTRNDVRRVTQFVHQLRAEGVPFRFAKDRKPGQVCIKFDGGMEMRILDPEHPEYAGGRVYDNGYSISLQTYHNDRTNRDQTQRWGRVAPRNAADSMALFRAARGETVVRKDIPDSKIGDPSAKPLLAGNNPVYHSSNDCIRMDYDRGANGEPLMIYMKKYSRTLPRIFVTPEDADKYLQETVEAARNRFRDELNLQELKDRSAEFKMSDDGVDADYMPELSQDSIIRAYQMKYWNTLVNNTPLYDPNYVSLNEDGDEVIDDDVAEKVMLSGDVRRQVDEHAEMLIDSLIGHYVGDHSDEQFNPVLTARFATNGHSLFRETDDLVAAMRRADMKPSEIKGNEFYSDMIRNKIINFDKSKAVPLEAYRDSFPKGSKTYDFFDMVYKSTVDGIEATGSSVTSTVVNNEVKNKNIWYDPDSGIIRYAAQMKNRQKGANGKDGRDHGLVIGDLGQVFAPDEHGIVRTPTHMFVPGYEGEILPNKPGENKPWEDRVILRGYEQVLREQIKFQIHESTMAPSGMRRHQISADSKDPDEQILFDMLTQNTADPVHGVRYNFKRVTKDKMEKEEGVVLMAGAPTNLNHAIQNLYDRRLPLDFMEQHRPDGIYAHISMEAEQARLDTLAARVKFTNELKESANRQGIYRAQTKDGASFDVFNDNHMDGLMKTGGRNIAIIEDPSRGVFDVSFTGNGAAQGVIRYLVTGAKVNPDGSVVRSADLNDSCALTKYLERQGCHMDKDAPDRGDMTRNGFMTAYASTEPVGVAQISFGMNTFEDGIVISSEFAEKYRVPDAHHPGQMRDLKPGDKIECHGNKGVVARVVDRFQDPAEAKTEIERKSIEWFKANPGMDIVMSPYSAVSRFNAGMAAEAMDCPHRPETLMSPDGQAYPGSLGYLQMRVLVQTVDTKSHSNTEDGQLRRSYGAQMLWALASNNCPEIIKDSFKNNGNATLDVREYLITCGLDMDECGCIRDKYTPHEGEQRRVFKMGEPMYSGNGGPGSFEVTKMVNKFESDIGVSGGFVELPFQLDFPRAKSTGQFQDEQRKFPVNPDSDPNHPTYLMPLMSAFMRSGQEMFSGESRQHDYTKAYSQIYRQSLVYRQAEMRLENAEQLRDIANKPDTELTDEERQLFTLCGGSTGDALGYKKALKSNDLDAFRAHCRSDMAQAVMDANNAYAKITFDIIDHRFQTKHNIFRTGLMSAKQEDSATAVWNPDPTCPVDTIYVGPEMVSVLGLAEPKTDDSSEVKAKPDAMVLVHRDPVLKGSGIRYMHVEVRDGLEGISVHPAGIPGGMDGDFDGDSVGLHVPQSKAAKREAMERLSVEANLLNRFDYDPKTGRNKLFIAGGQDVTAGLVADQERVDALRAAGKDPGPSLKERYEQLEIDVNQFEKDFENKKIDYETVTKLRREALKGIDSYLEDVAVIGFGRHAISYADPESHIQSIENYVKDGAKGSLKKVQTYARFAGIKYDTDEKGGLVPGTTTMVDHTLATVAEREGIRKAKNMQQEYTGTAGKFSIRAVKALMNVCPNEATALNSLATQGVLQVKHSAEMADRFEDILSTAARDLWRGYKLESSEKTVQTYEYSVDPQSSGGNRHVKVETVERKIPTWVPVQNESGYPVYATPEEFKKQFTDIYGSTAVNSKGDVIGLGLDVNPILLDNLTRELTTVDRTGQAVMMNLEREAVTSFAPLLQRAAYDGDFGTLVQAASGRESFFEIAPNMRHTYDFNNCMATDTIRNNLMIRKAMQEASQNGVPYTGPAYKALVRSDTQVDGRTKQRAAHLQNTVSGEDARQRDAAAREVRNEAYAAEDERKAQIRKVMLQNVKAKQAELLAAGESKSVDKEVVLRRYGGFDGDTKLREIDAPDEADASKSKYDDGMQ